jgi:hypothetical protein
MPTCRFPSPKLSSTIVFLNLELSNPQTISSVTTNISTGHVHLIVNLYNTPQGIPFPASNIFPNPHDIIVVSGDFRLIILVATELQIFYYPRKRYINEPDIADIV